MKNFYYARRKSRYEVVFVRSARIYNTTYFDKKQKKILEKRKKCKKKLKIFNYVVTGRQKRKFFLANKKRECFEKRKKSIIPLTEREIKGIIQRHNAIVKL